MIGRRLPTSSSFVLAAARLRALQLDTARATAQTGSDKEKPQAQSSPRPAIANKVTGPAQRGLLARRALMGART